MDWQVTGMSNIVRSAEQHRKLTKHARNAIGRKHIAGWRHDVTAHPHRSWRLDSLGEIIDIRCDDSEVIMFLFSIIEHFIFPAHFDNKQQKLQTWRLRRCRKYIFGCWRQWINRSIRRTTQANEKISKPSVQIISIEKNDANYRNVWRTNGEPFSHSL